MPKRLFICASISFLFILLFSSQKVSAQTNVSGTISSNTTWDLAGSPYIVVGDITVNAGVTLTVDAGVEVKFNGNYSIDVWGILDSHGTANNLVKFTSNQTNPQPGDWARLLIINGSNVINYVQVEYANEGLYVSDNIVGATVQNSVLQFNNKGVTIGMSSGATVQNNSMTNNGNGIYTKPYATATITNNDITNNAEGIYTVCGVFSQCVIVANNNSIYSNSNFNFKVENLNGYNLSDVRINAENNWWGTTDPMVIMNKIWDYNDNSMLPSVDFAPFLNGPGGTPIGGNYIFGVISQNTTWGLSQSPYIVLASTKILSGVTVTIDAGVEIKFAGHYVMEVWGILNSLGTANNRVKFTSNQTTPQPGDWDMVLIVNGSNVINYVQVEYANEGLYVSDNIVGATVQNSVFQFNNKGVTIGMSSGATVQNNSMTNNGNGIYTKPYATATITNNDITNNTEGIYTVCGVFSQCVIGVSNNSIYSNTNYNFKLESYNGYNLSSLTINAENNWWGTIDPLIIAQKIWDNADNALLPVVDFDPYLNSAGGTPLVLNVSFNPQFLDVFNAGTTTIHYDLDKDANVTINIYGHQSHALIRTLINGAPRLAGPNQEIWDGKDNSAQNLPEGLYYFEISAITSQNETGGYSPPYYPGSVQITTGSVTPAFIDPYKGEIFNVNYDMATSGFVTLRAGFNMTNGFVRELFTDQPRDTTNNNDVWDGRDFNGNIIPSSTIQYVVYGWTNILPDNGLVIRDNSAARIEFVKADPYAFYPRNGEAADIQYRLSLDAIVTVEIRDPAGFLVRTLVNNQQQVTGDHSVIWDGKDFNGNTVVSEGHYRVQVQTLDLRGPVTRSLTGNITVFK